MRVHRPSDGHTRRMADESRMGPYGRPQELTRPRVDSVTGLSPPKDQPACRYRDCATDFERELRLHIEVVCRPGRRDQTEIGGAGKEPIEGAQLGVRRVPISTRRVGANSHAGTHRKREPVSNIRRNTPRANPRRAERAPLADGLDVVVGGTRRARQARAYRMSEFTPATAIEAGVVPSVPEGSRRQRCDSNELRGARCTRPTTFGFCRSSRRSASGRVATGQLANASRRQIGCTTVPRTASKLCLTFRSRTDTSRDDPNCNSWRPTRRFAIPRWRST